MTWQTKVLNKALKLTITLNNCSLHISDKNEYYFSNIHYSLNSDIFKKYKYKLLVTKNDLITIFLKN